MTRVEITTDTLTVHVEGWDRLFAFKSELRIPLPHVADVARAGDEARGWLHGIRAPGTNIPGIITAGTFYTSEGRVFWDVHDPEKAIAIHLHDDRYAKLIVEVADPDETIALITRAISP